MPNKPGAYRVRPLAARGQMFAPVYFQRPVYARSNFVYTPSVGIVSNALLTSLFVRPSHHSYYFGDYYAVGYRNYGYTSRGRYVPSYSNYGSGYGGPIFTDARAFGFANPF